MENKDKVVFDEDLLQDDSDALSLEDFGNSFISNPAVGNSVSFKIRKVVKLTGQNLLGKKKDGKIFKKNLSNVDYGYEVVTDNGSKYTVSSWEVYGKMKSIFHKLGTINGVELKITHICDGMKPENKDRDKYEVAALVNGVYKTLDRDTKEWSN